jgi:hypothetical protein
MASKVKACGCILILGLLCGCRPAGATPFGTIPPPDAAAPVGATPTFPPAAAALTATPTLRPTYTFAPSDTPTVSPTPWPPGFTPTVPPTPTRGLPPTVAPAARPECPEPTQATVEITRREDPAEYETVLLDLLSATGELKDFQKSIAVPNDPSSSLGTEVQVFHEDVNADSAAEFVLSIHQPFQAEDAEDGPVGDPYRTAVFIFGCRDAQYVTLHRLILDRKETDLHSGILAVEDLNRNGIREVAVSTVENVGEGGRQHLFVRILEWNGSSFRDVLIPQREDFYSSNTVNAAVDFRDVDGNGTQDVVVPNRTWPEGAGVVCEGDGGPDRNTDSIWMWEGEQYRYMWNLYSGPQYRFQAAYDGDYYSYIGLFDQAEISYLRAVFDESLKPGSKADWKRDGGCALDAGDQPDYAEPQSIKAYARFRLVELYVRVGRVMEAEYHRTYLRNEFPLGAAGYMYAYLANAFWWEYVKEEEISAACARVRQEAEKYAESVFDPFAAYGSLNPGPTVDTVCPFAAAPSG